ncbi:5,10-methylenetetrahydrofolate reductase [Nitzschia inconspicua]|uniref:5,10-methylenetetrahydrofolate reductase n=1 Tax=Nitzschia inconspicua TaxID=303405 RepID=A0A9K3LI98_9STRA|nr:5,10-methylenetetrahydrofolate reductase [Nitzschia inconspicua]
MTKIIDEIHAWRRRRCRDDDDCLASSSAALFYSLEFFPPKTQAGLDNLLTRMDRMIQRLNPLFVDVTWGTGGSTLDKTLQVAAHAAAAPQRSSSSSSSNVLLHLTTTGMDKSQLLHVLDLAKSRNVQNVLVLRGDPPKGQRRWQVNEYNQNGHCARAIDLVKLIRKEHGDYFGIAVAGHPEGHPSSLSPEEELVHLKEKVDAGAHFIVTQFFYDVDKFLDYVKRCREVGITCPIIPGIMPIQSYTTLIKMTQYCGVVVPSSILNRLEAVNKNDDEAVKLLGCEIAAEMCQQIYTRSNGDIDGVHFYTLNLERSVTEIIGMLGSIKSIQHPSIITIDDSLSPPSLVSQKRPQDEVRPINWANRPQSYAIRTEAWDEFPNGRWGDATSPAFGELSDMSHFYSFSLGDKEERKSLLGSEPQTPQDIYNVFARYVEGTIPHIPWCETPLQPESMLIQEQLKELNSAGFMTINSQPSVNGKPSGDPIVGWGGTGGFVYQKEYCEFFCSPSHVQALIEDIQDHPSLNLYAVDVFGKQIKSIAGGGGVTALTWGVFPNREIVQPTIFDPTVFLIWAEEAFSLWNTVWLPLYEPGSTSHTLIETIHDTYFLVAVIDNDYIGNGVDKKEGSRLWHVMRESHKIRAES